MAVGVFQPDRLHMSAVPSLHAATVKGAFCARMAGAVVVGGRVAVSDGTCADSVTLGTMVPGGE